MDLPATTGEAIDLLYEKRQKRLMRQREFEVEMKAIREEEAELEEFLFAQLGNEKLEGARGSLATASVKHTTVPQVKDWDAVYQWILDNRAFDLLHKRFTSSAWAERREAGQEVPGVETFDKLEITLNKR